MSEIVPREAQFTGSVVGQCLGDALGFPLEGMPPGTCRRYVEQELRPRTGRPRARSGFQPGQYTDDSQLARELLISFVERERFDPADYASRIANQFASGAVVGPGRATEAAARRLVAGLSSLPRRLLGDHLHGDLGWGDVDTTAAMAGAISGAHLGLEAVPREWAERVQDQGSWGYERLVGLAARAHGLSGRDSQLQPDR